MLFFSKFVDLCNVKGISPSAAAEEMGYQRSVVTRWSKGSAPREATIHRVAAYFNVAPDTFKEQKKTVTIDSDGLDALDMKFVSLIKRLSDQEKQMLVAQMEALIRLREQ